MGGGGLAAHDLETQLSVEARSWLTTMTLRRAESGTLRRPSDRLLCIGGPISTDHGSGNLRCLGLGGGRSGREALFVRACASGGAQLEESNTQQEKEGQRSRRLRCI